MEQLTPFIMHHWTLWLTLVVIILLIFINEFITSKKSAKALSAAAAVAMINHEQAIVIDIRDEEPFRTGHIIDAIRIPSKELNQKRLEKYKARPIILVCARGVQAATLATQLQKQGCPRVMSLAGGITAWQAAGLPLVKG